MGILLAAGAGVMVLCTRRSSARLRYNLLLTGLGIFAGAVVFTFIRQLLRDEASPGLFTVQPDNLPAAVSLQPHLSSNNYDILTGLIRAHANSIVLIWLLIVVARTLQLVTGLQSLYYLRRRNISAISGDWEERVRVLAAQLGITRVVRIAESGIARVPMVVGHLKPLVLIPAGLIINLPSAAIEAVLVHELAHIRRGDYLVNLLVSILEIVFFFNPAVLWLADLIRAERENCCDDMALAHTGSKTSYIEALVACEEYKLTVPAYAMAFSGRKDHLLGRVKRMLSDSNPSLNIRERVVLGIGLLTAILFTAAFTNAGKMHTLVTTVKQAAGVVVLQKKDTVRPLETGKINIDKQERVVPHRATRVATVARQADPITPVTRIAPLTSVLSSLGSIRQKPDYSPKNPSPANYKANYQPYPADTNRVRYKAYDEGTNREKLTAALIADGIIQNGSALQSFKLSDKEFIVNGKKMPDEIYQKYRKAFVPVPENGKQGSWSWMYNYSEETTNGSSAMNRINDERFCDHELILKI